MHSIVLVALYGTLVRALLPCYYPNGQLAFDRPCNLSATVSTCCGDTYACLSNNICVSTSLTNRTADSTTYVRGSCTDATWDSPECPRFCINPKHDDIAGGEGIMKCPDTALDTYFCVDGNPSNCSKGENILSFSGTPSYIFNPALNQISTTSPSPTTSTSSTARTTTVTTFSTPVPQTPTPSPSAPPPPSSHTTALGAGLGVPLGVLALAAAGYIVLNRRRKSGLGKAWLSQGALPEGPHHPPEDRGPSHLPRYEPTEVSVYRAPQVAKSPEMWELRADERRFELGGEEGGRGRVHELA